MNQTQKWVIWYHNRPKWQQAAIVSSIVILFSLAGLFVMTSGPETVNNPTTGITFGWTVGVFLKLGAVLALILVIAVFFRRYQGGKFGNQNRQMSIVETLTLSPRRSLHLVRVGEQIYFIGATDQSITLLSETDTVLRTDLSSNLNLHPAADDQGRSFADVFEDNHGQGLPEQRH